MAMVTWPPIQMQASKTCNQRTSAVPVMFSTGPHPEQRARDVAHAPCGSPRPCFASVSVLLTDGQQERTLVHGNDGVRQALSDNHHQDGAVEAVHADVGVRVVLLYPPSRRHCNEDDPQC